MSAARRQRLLSPAITLAVSVALGWCHCATAAPDDTDGSDAAAKGDSAVDRSAVQSPVADMRQARSFMVKGSYSEAADCFKRILDTNADNVEALAGLGMALGRQYKLDEADQQFEKVLAIQPNNPVAHCGKAMVLLYRVEKNELGTMSKTEALHAAGKECNKALDADTRVVEAHYLLGTVFKDEGRLDLASQAFSGALRLDPRYVRAYNMLASVQLQKGSFQQAIENYKQAISIQPTGITAHLGLAEVYTRQSREREAISELNEVIGVNPKNIAARVALAKILEAHGDIDGALKSYKQLKDAHPEDMEAYLEISRLCEKQGEYSQALNELQSALKAVPKTQAISVRIAHDQLMLGQIDEALRGYEAAAAADPSDHAAIAGLAIGCYAKSLRYAPPVFVATAEFQMCWQRISQDLKKTPNDQLLQAADAVMRALSGQMSEMTPPLASATLDNKLIWAELLAARRQFSDSSAAFLSAINGTTNADEVATAADTALVLRDLDSAEAAYKRVMIFAGQQQRAQLGLAAVQAARDEAVRNMNDANAALQAKQFDKAIDRYRASIAANSRLAGARIGLAEALEKQGAAAEVPLTAFRDALFQYQTYLALSPNIYPKEQERVQKHISRLESVIGHLKQNPRTSIKELFERVL